MGFFASKQTGKIIMEERERVKRQLTEFFLFVRNGFLEGDCLDAPFEQYCRK